MIYTKQYHYICFRYFLAATEYFLYGESIIYYFKEIVMVDSFLLPFAVHHRFASFTLYVIGNIYIYKFFFSFFLKRYGWLIYNIFIINVILLGFVFFVMNLRKGQYRYQMSQFGWTHMALLLIVVQSHFIVDNILEGLIW